jgi:hypothetical protein
LHGVSNLKIGRDGMRIARFILQERFGRRASENVQVPDVDMQELSEIQELPAVALAVPPETL